MSWVRVVSITRYAKLTMRNEGYILSPRRLDHKDDEMR